MDKKEKEETIKNDYSSLAKLANPSAYNFGVPSIHPEQK